MDRDRIKYLWICYINQACSKEEKREFFQLMQEEPSAAVIRELMGKTLNEEPDATAFNPDRRDEMLSAIFNKPVLPAVKKFPVRYQVWSAVAAILLMVLGVSLYWYRSNDMEPLISQTEPKELQIYSKGNAATLSLADGTVVDLSNAHDGIKVQSSGIQYDNGEMLGQSQVGKVLWQTIQTPKGGQYQIELEDGTRVWLNAASSLRFPSTFKGGEERTVELSGEAYFEVSKRLAHGKNQPFRVRSGQQDVLVLGTQFNVEAYAGPNPFRTTLVEGRVQLESNGVRRVLAPGQQGVIDGEGIQLKAVDVQEYTAWKEGDFYVQRKRLAELIPALENWYDIKIECNEVAKNQYVTLQISRDKPLNSMLKILNESIGIQYRIEPDKVYITR